MPQDPVCQRCLDLVTQDFHCLEMKVSPLRLSYLILIHCQAFRGPVPSSGSPSASRLKCSCQRIQVCPSCGIQLRAWDFRTVKRADLNRHFSEEDTDGLQETEKMLDITSYQRNSNQNHNEVPPHIGQNSHHQEVYKQQMLERVWEPSYTARRNVSWFSLYGDSSKN